MTRGVKCPDCGAALTAGQARSGICPRCAMRLALQDQTVPTEPTDPGAEPAEIPQTIGPYRVIRMLGEGGMGVVYLGEQLEPIRREVAIKVIKHGMDTRQVVTRFEAERQAMALMEHPAIAQVFAAGATEGGRPYFVMEFVQGEPITRYADRYRLGLPERLELFSKVCAGVQHAHQKGVIHRDLKPSNILVVRQGEEALPKIIDFGVAKATSRRLTEQTLFTELGIMIGTPEYMSPEQAEVSALDVDTRTDVYSLGVLLYELLTGQLPFDSAELRKAGHEEIRRRIREEEPAMPSSRVSTLGDAAVAAARTRGVDPPSWSRLLRGDLDWIVLKCLAKEPGRRYGSPSELSADLRRHLSDEPVVARPPSALYKSRKFVRRHKLLVTSTVLVALALLVGVAGTTTFALREADQRRATDAALADLRQVVDFQQGMLSGIEVEAMGRRLASRLRERIPEQVDAAAFDRSLEAVNLTDAALDLLDEEILGRASEEAGRRFADRPEVEIKLRDSLGDTFYEIGLFDRAGKEYERRYELADGADPDAAQDLGRLYWKTGKGAEAEPLLLEALEGHRVRHGEEHADVAGTMTNLGLVCASLGRADEAVEWHTRALEIYRRTVGPTDMLAVRASGDLAAAYQRLAKLDEGGGHLDRALALYEEAIDLAERELGEDHPETIKTWSNYAAALYEAKRADEALAINERCVEHSRRTLGATHHDTILQMSNLASNYDKVGRKEDAERLYREILDLVVERHGEVSRVNALTRAEYAKFLLRSGKTAEGAENLERALIVMPRVLGAAHPTTVMNLIVARIVYVDVLGGRPEYASAARSVQARIVDALAREGAGEGVPPPWLNGEAWKIMFEYPEDLRDHEVALKATRRANEATGFSRFDFLHTLAWANHLTGRHDVAVEMQKKAIESLPEDKQERRPELEQNLARFEAALDENRG